MKEVNSLSSRPAKGPLSDLDPEVLARFLQNTPLDDSDSPDASSETPEPSASEPLSCEAVGAVLHAPVTSLPDISLAEHQACLARTIAQHINSSVFPWPEETRERVFSILRAFPTSPELQEVLEAYLTAYAEMGGTQAQGDVYGTLIRQFRDAIEAVLDLRLDFCLHADVTLLQAALGHTTGLALRVPLSGLPNKDAAINFNWATPLTTLRQLFLSTFIEWILAEGALAQRLHDDEAVKLFTNAYLLVYGHIGGSAATVEQIRHGFPEQTIKKVIQTLGTAHQTLFAHVAFAGVANDYWGEAAQ